MKKLSWTDTVQEATAVQAIFGPNPPTLEGIDIHEITLHRDGPTVLLRFDLQEFPIDPPKKWSTAGFNRVQIRLLALGVQHLQIAGLQSNMKVDLSINKNGRYVRLLADNGTVQFDLGAESVIVQGISAYREGSPD